MGTNHPCENANGTPFGTYFNPAGYMNVYGTRAGKMSMEYEGNFMETESYVAIFESTYEAIAKWLPAPLEPDRDIPPFVMFVYWDTDCAGFADGRRNQYRGCALLPACKYVGEDGTVVKGNLCAVEYVDGIDGDKTAGAEMILAMGGNKGCNKKLGNIVAKKWGDSFKFTCERRGTVLVDAEFTSCKPVKPQMASEAKVADAKAQAVLNMMARDTLGLREVPNVDHRGYTARSIVKLGSTYHPDNKIFYMAAGGTCNIKFGHLETDPVDLFAPEGVSVGGVTHVIKDNPKTSWLGCEEVVKLPLTGPGIDEPAPDDPAYADYKK